MSDLNKNKISESPLLYCGLLVLISAATYIQVLGFGFLVIDDSVYVTANEHVLRGLTTETVKWAFTTVEAEFWHPLTWISLMLDTTVYGISPRGFHSTNLLLHIGSCIFLFLGFNRMTRQHWRSFLLAAIFAAHPVHVESVAWIAERKEVLCGFFWCAALYAYALYAEKPLARHYCLVIFLSCMGLMAKPMMVTFPFVLLLLDYWPLQRHLLKNEKQRLQIKAILKRFLTLLIEKIPLFILTGIFVALAIYAQKAGEGIVGLDIYSLTDRIANALISYMSYMLKTFYPVNLSIFYPFRMDMPSMKILGNALAFCSLTGMSLFYARRFPYLFTGWFWFIGTLVPVIGIIKIGDFAMADRYMYTPITGLLLAGVWLGADILRRAYVPKMFPVFIGGGLILVSTVATWTYLDKWENSETLFRHAAIAAAPNYFAHFTLGHIYAGRGNYVNAEQEFKRAVALRPDKSKLHIDLGRAIGSQGRFSDAVPHFESVLKKRNNHGEAHFYLGLALAGNHQLNNALEHFLLSLISSEIIVKEHSDSLRSRINILQKYGETHNALGLLGISVKTDSCRQWFVKGFNKWQHQQYGR